MLSKIARLVLLLVLVSPLGWLALQKGEAGGLKQPKIQDVPVATFTVTNTNDSGAGSLRQAIANANATTANDTITFSIPTNDPNCNANGICTIRLTSGELVVNSVSTAGSLTVSNSTGASRLLISGNFQSRVFFVNLSANLTLDGVTVTNGNSTGTSFGGNGGGIYNRSIVTLTNSAVNNNTAPTLGGGIYNDNNAMLMLTNSTVSGNTGRGGIHNDNGTVRLTNTIVSNNSTQGSGGGIYNNSGTVSLTNSTVSNNTAQSLGGGIYVTNGISFLTLTDSIVSGNTAQSSGGGIYSSGSNTLTLINSTVNNNTATNNPGGGIYSSDTATLTNSTVSGNTAPNNIGGGIYSTGNSILTLTNSTVSGNTALFSGGLWSNGTINLTNGTVTNNRSNSTTCTTCGGGIFNINTGTVNLRNVIVAGNTVSNASSGPDFFGPVSITSSYNIIGNNRGATGITNGVNGNQVGTNASPLDVRLALLDNNGGPTQTHALLANSPALDKGSSFSATTDQRGSTRPFDLPGIPNGSGGDGADIGAFESQTDPGLSTFQFSAANFAGNEASGQATVTVTRAGSTATAASVSFRTVDGPTTTPCFQFNGQASSRCDYATTSGTLTFNPGVTSLTFPVLLNNDAYAEGNETLNIALGNPAGATLGAQNTATLTIQDDDTAPNLASNQLLARLRGSEVVPANSSAATGTATATLTGNNATLNLSFSGLGGAQTSAHIHGPAPFNDTQTGPLIATLPNGTVTNFALNNLTATQVAELKGGLWYVDVHSSSFPNGEIRASLLGNPLEDPRVFVTQQYLDFLGRSAGAGPGSGLEFWVGEITRPGGAVVRDTVTLARQRLFVSNNFFFSPEFQRSGAFVFRLYRAAFGNNQPFPNERPDNDADPFCAQHTCPVRRLHLLGYSKFATEFAVLQARATTAGQATPEGSQAVAQYQLVQAFVQQPEFVAQYPASQTGAQFVDALLGTVQSILPNGVFLPAGERDKLIVHFNNGGRALVLFHVANDYWNGCTTGTPCVPPGPVGVAGLPASYGVAVDMRPFIDAEYNKAFVATQFYGFFRRDADPPGYNFWLREVGMSPLRDQTRQRYMVCYQIYSNEYQERFGFGLPRQPVDTECTNQIFGP